VIAFLQLWWKSVVMALVLGYATVTAYGKGGAHVQQKWDAESAQIATALAAAFEKSAKETEVIRATFIEYKRGAEAVTAGLELDVAAGRQRLRLKASCVPNTADAGRAGSGTAELDATARPAYFALRRGIDEQRGLLNLCRAELKKRSATLKYMKNQ